MIMNMSIKFYKLNDEYGCFSNFSRNGFTLEGKYWITSEHYFQAKKFEGTDFEEIIRLMDNPMDVAIKGRDRSLPLRKDWDKVKDNIMRKAVFEKFSQNEDIRHILLSTIDEELIECTTSDYYWGCGKNGTGKNMLGIILMEVRELLKEKVSK